MRLKDAKVQVSMGTSHVIKKTTDDLQSRHKIQNISYLN
jgi:hypothetical protein